MLIHGFRNHIVNDMKGRAISGSINRAYTAEYGQHLILTVTATPELLAEMEANILACDYWDWSLQRTEDRQSMTHTDFKIVQSFRGAVSGPGSDVKNDNASEKMSSRGSRKS
jgi:hypothetical protein